MNRLDIEPAIEPATRAVVGIRPVTWSDAWARAGAEARAGAGAGGRRAPDKPRVARPAQERRRPPLLLRAALPLLLPRRRRRRLHPPPLHRLPVWRPRHAAAAAGGGGGGGVQRRDGGERCVAAAMGEEGAAGCAAGKRSGKLSYAFVQSDKNALGIFALFQALFPVNCVKFPIRAWEGRFASDREPCA